MTPHQRATIETVARQASIPEAERRAWVAGAEWGLAQHDAPEPQKPLPVAALVGGKEWEAPVEEQKAKPCPTCGFRIVTRKAPPFTIDDDPPAQDWQTEYKAKVAEWNGNATKEAAARAATAFAPATPK